MGKNAKTLTYVADFETTTDPHDCRVWAWGCVNVDDIDNSFIYGNDIESYFRFLARKNTTTYFHNLAFDGSFIIDKLFRLGFVYTEERAKIPRTFTALISDSGKFYTVRVVWESGVVTEFRDSLKKLPMSVSAVARAFKLDESKLSIDYHEYRPVGHELTDDEVLYLRSDVVIVARAIKVQLDQGMSHLTVGSDAIAEYKRLVGGSKYFERVFPILSESMDAEIRRAYRGGWAYADVRFKGRVLRRNGRVYDVNSLYPFIMRERLLPYGEPLFTFDKPEVSDDYPLFVTNITFTAKLKPDHLPCIQVKNTRFFLPTEYQTEIVEPVDMSCTNVDLDLWFEHYDMNILSYNGSWLFRGIRGVFNEYVDKWMEVKKTSTGGLRLLAKLFLNALYGKFATNPHVTGKYPIMIDDVVCYKTGPEETRNPVYTPMGVFITAWARDYTIRAAQQNYETFAYADTDSLHLLVDDDPSTLNIDPVELGAWKRELIFDSAIYVRAKCYTEHDASWRIPFVGEYVTHIAGLPSSIADHVTFEDYYNGKTWDGKLLPTRVPGGIVLTTTSFTLKDVLTQ